MKKLFITLVVCIIFPFLVYGALIDVSKDSGDDIDYDDFDDIYANDLYLLSLIGAGDIAGIIDGSTAMTTPVLGTPTSGDGSNLTGINATTVTITDNESTNENNAIIFSSGGDIDGGNMGLESDGNLVYRPLTGALSAPSFFGAVDTRGYALRIDTGTDPDVDESGEISADTDGANVANDYIIRMFDGTNQVPVASRNIPIQHKFNAAGVVTDDPVWYNDTGMTFTIEYIAINCDSNLVTVTLDEQTSFINITHLAEIDVLATDSAGTDIYWTDACTSGCEDPVPSHTVIEAGHGILAAYDAAGVGTILIRGWFNADVD